MTRAECEILAAYRSHPTFHQQMEFRLFQIPSRIPGFHPGRLGFTSGVRVSLLRVDWSDSQRVSASSARPGKQLLESYLSRRAATRMFRTAEVILSKGPNPKDAQTPAEGSLHPAVERQARQGRRFQRELAKAWPTPRFRETGERV